eukprot:1114484-Pyramimonas_sp.AAC.1
MDGPAHSLTTSRITLAVTTTGKRMSNCASATLVSHVRVSQGVQCDDCVTPTGAGRTVCTGSVGSSSSCPQPRPLHPTTGDPGDRGRSPPPNATSETPTSSTCPPAPPPFSASPAGSPLG